MKAFGHFRPKTAQTQDTLGWDSLALRSKLSFEHFGTGAKISGQCGPIKPVLKCLES